MELVRVYSFATLVAFDGMNGVITQKTKHESHTYALKVEEVYSFEFKAQTFSKIRYNCPKRGSSNATNSSCHAQWTRHCRVFVSLLKTNILLTFCIDVGSFYADAVGLCYAAVSFAWVPTCLWTSIYPWKNNQWASSHLGCCCVTFSSRLALTVNY